MVFHVSQILCLLERGERMNIPQTAGMDTTKPAAKKNLSGAGFTIAGVLILSLAVWIGAQNASPHGRKFLNLFLFVLLLSIMILRWNELSPLVFRNGG